MSNEFERIWSVAVGTVSDERRAEGRTGVDALADALNGLSFTGVVALLGAHDDGAAPGPTGALGALVASVAASEAVRAAGLDPDHVERLLRATLTGRDDDSVDEPVRLVLSQAVRSVAEHEGLVASDDELGQATELLLTGEFLADIADATAAIARVAPTLPLAVVDDALTSATGFPVVAAALIAEIPAALLRPRETLKSLRDGQLRGSERVLRRTLSAVYRFASLRAIFKTLRRLLRPDDETVRLALMVYSRAHGTPLTGQDLDVLRDTVFVDDAPDLAPVLREGLRRAEARHGARLAAALSAMRAIG